MAEGPIGVQNFQLETKIATEAPVQRKFVQDLERNHVNWILLDNAPETGDDTFMQQAHHGSKMLDQYIAAAFEEEARFGAYQVLHRRAG